MNKEQILTLQGALDRLLHQIENHQQGKAPIIELDRLITEARNKEEFEFRVKTLESLESITAAICDSSGLGKLNLMLKNARVPSKYYDIFYEMLGLGFRNSLQEDLSVESVGGGGDLKPLCIDCGAHSGLISDIMLHCGAQVVAYEPNLHLRFFLERKYANNPDITFHSKAVGAECGKAQFLTFQGRMLSQGNRIISSAQDSETSSSYEVEVVDLCEKLEQILQTHKKIYFLKLDIEGAEFDIMEKLISKGLHKRITYIACETHEYMFEDGEEKISKLRARIDKEKIQNILLDWI